MTDVNSLVGDWDLETDNKRTMLFVSRSTGYELHTSSFESDEHFVILADHETNETVAEIEVSNEDEENTAILMLMGAISHPEVFDNVGEALEDVSRSRGHIFD
ncbi:MAG TPA: hypothetical protein VFJ06_07830 [Halococcus sp.]|nr:hypothetical protein [Halococcus sp.]